MQAKGPVELIKTTTPGVEMETNEFKTQVDGYKVMTGNFKDSIAILSGMSMIKKISSVIRVYG